MRTIKSQRIDLFQIMKKISVVLSLIIVFAILTGFNRQQDPTKKECLDCHDEMSATFSEKYLHYPFKSQQCDACHDETTFGFTEKGSRLCTVCHRDYEAEKDKNVIHAAVDDCTSCHDPHASRNATLLNETIPSLCFLCHEGIPKDKKLLSTHLPFERGECMSCHDPHISPHPSLLLDTPTKLCATCHGIQESGFKKAHLNLLTEGAACLSCHEGHFSANRGLIFENAHQPFSEGICDACHEKKKEGEKTVLIAQGSLLCTSCHSDIQEQIDSKFPHLPAEQDCLNCHGPHATAQKSLLIMREEELCKKCHADTLVQTGSSMIHEPFSSGTCGSCHHPHGSQSQGILIKGERELCMDCHSGIAEEVEKNHPHSALEQGCVSCHEAHMGQLTSLLKEEGENLCNRCHESRSKKISRYVHYPYKEGNCSTCHLPHAGKGKANLKMEGDDICLFCHPSQHNDFPHPMGALPSNELDIKPDNPLGYERGEEITCATCHVPHSGDIVFLLRVSVTEGQLCYECHQR